MKSKGGCPNWEVKEIIDKHQSIKDGFSGIKYFRRNGRCFKDVICKEKKTQQPIIKATKKISPLKGQFNKLTLSQRKIIQENLYKEGFPNITNNFRGNSARSKKRVAVRADMSLVRESSVKQHTTPRWVRIRFIF